MRPRIGCVALLTLCLCLPSCNRGNGVPEPTPQPGTPQPLPQVEVTEVKSQMLATTARLPAELKPYDSVDVFAKQTGFVKSIKVDRGSRVGQGQLVAELVAPELAAQRAQASAQYESAQSQLAAAQAKLAADQATYEHMNNAAKVPGVVAANDLDIAQRAAQADAASVEALRKGAAAVQEGLRAVTQLESYLTITAPFSGEVTTRYVSVGALVGPGAGPGATTPIVRIETTNRHRLVVPVPENQAAGVPEGSMVNFTVPSFPGKVFRAPIARISRDVDPKTRTMPVELDVRDPGGQLVPGTFCEVEWPVRRTYATLFVPVTAVGGNLERTFVLRVKNSHVEWIDVKTGATSGDLIEVFGDLSEGDQVATKGTDQIKAGAEVSTRPAAPK
ncbi:MAG TPA: efflux RND transporter periplasmic adaptor subunit [Blastocatellia bacterium]|nr:efflux RND transporter periplasmic adaptor subunit [Blastocatellia bacterium]